MKTEQLLQIYKHTNFETYAKLLILQDMGSYLFPNLNFDDLKLAGYADFELKLTKKGEEILAKCGKPVKLNVDFVKLHGKLQSELQQLTGKKQKVLQGKYSFLPNAKDLETKLLKVSKKYKLDNWNKIEKLLLQYIYTCHKANWEFVNLMEYYIEKNNSSRLANDYENFQQQGQEKKTTFEI